MFQNFTSPSSPDQGPARLAALRVWMDEQTLNGFIVPRADRHQGEYVAACDERLSWLTGFTGSAGFACVLEDIAGVFIDGRYRLQVLDQVADVFIPVHWPETQLQDWLIIKAQPGAVIGFDPWLHTVSQIETLRDSAHRFRDHPKSLPQWGECHLARQTRPATYGRLVAPREPQRRGRSKQGPPHWRRYHSPWRGCGRHHPAR